MSIFSPFPFFLDGQQYHGVLFGWSKRCRKCKHTHCREPNSDELLTCSYGFNYQKISDSLVISGFIVKNSPSCSDARKKIMKSYPNLIVNNDQVTHAVEAMRDISSQEDREVADLKKDVIRRYIQDEQYKPEFLDAMKPEINKGLSFVHDYKQINAQIAQNINVIIETNHQGNTIEDKLKSASHAEQAIYWASKFLTEKLNVAKFLLHPEWITKESECDSFRFHGLFIKYLRIYQYMFDKKKIRISVSGESFRNVFGNPGAIGVIIHTFLDNALKYSRPGNRVDVYISDEDDEIYFSVSSHGPRIKANEKEKIFQPFFRGEEAQKMQEEGAGYGLYIAQMVAIQIGTRITMEQDPSQKAKSGHLTTFSITIPYR